MKLYAITVPTVGYFVYEVQAYNEEEAKEFLLEQNGRLGPRIECVEASAGDWVIGGEWEIEESGL